MHNIIRTIYSVTFRRIYFALSLTWSTVTFLSITGCAKKHDDVRKTEIEQTNQQARKVENPNTKATAPLSHETSTGRQLESPEEVVRVDDLTSPASEHVATAPLSHETSTGRQLESPEEVVRVDDLTSPASEHVAAAPLSHETSTGRQPESSEEVVRVDDLTSPASEHVAAAPLSHETSTGRQLESPEEVPIPAITKEQEEAIKVVHKLAFCNHVLPKAAASISSSTLTEEKKEEE